MTLIYTIDVFCNTCPNWINGHTGAKPNARRARQNARENGWVRRRDTDGFVDLCPDCASGARMTEGK